ncbi:MAG: hypothetical protein CME16_00705 [Gemmatimonadetes bacterium]|nr:hypothetical protein [Gemmatimonadota bacterium]
MLKSLVFRAVAGMLIAGCGINEVTVEIKGGDGRKLRLDADDLEFKFNRLVDAGTFSFKELQSGTYKTSVVAGNYHETKELQLEPAPITGVDNYSLVFEIPQGSNTSFERRGTIVYASTKTNVRNWDLFSIKADGSELRQLTATPEFEQHPAWSPDGRKVTFTRGDVMTNFDIYVMDEDGSEVQRLTEHAERDERATWSPDGKTIAFVSQRNGVVEIWLMDADGSNKRKLIQGREPAWSPDSRKVAFVSGHYDGNDEIYLINVDGSNRQRLTDNNKFDWFPAFSPDGGRLAFCSERFGGQELMLMKNRGDAQTRITIAEKTYEVEPAWSPDGKGLVYSGKMDRDYDIYIMETSGFDIDDVEVPSGLPINLTDSADRDEKSPDWRPF